MEASQASGRGFESRRPLICYNNLRRLVKITAVYGNTTGLGKKELQLLERLSRRHTDPSRIISPELARTMVEISEKIKRQLGLLINRYGEITHVIVGNAHGIFIPNLEDYPLGRRPLRGLRLVHTHLRGESLTKDDLTDLRLLRFDLVCAITIRNSLPYMVHIAHLLSEGGGVSYAVLEPRYVWDLEMDFREFINNIDSEMERSRVFTHDTRERAILISVSTKSRYELEESMEELKELAESAGVIVVDTVIQRVKELNPRYLMGEGKLKEVIINALDKGATLLIFDQDLSPSQMKSITELTELKAIDRSQLILDIFARRAHSRDGKIQVELAQLRYRLPRLTGKGSAMSRLTGGIGGRGPGEMKLEIDRRRVKERIRLLEKELESLSRARRQRKQMRVEKGIPIVSIVGYTNAGKSTLLNNLTSSNVFVEERMFATLDTSSRRLRFPEERNVIITDTVGFIKDLPQDLVAAFKSTLEELEDAHLLIHLVDISNPRFEQHIDSVEKILAELGLDNKERILVFNKIDRLDPEEGLNILRRYNAIGISAINRNTFYPLLSAIYRHIWKEEMGEEREKEQFCISGIN